MAVVTEVSAPVAIGAITVSRSKIHLLKESGGAGVVELDARALAEEQNQHDEN